MHAQRRDAQWVDADFGGAEKFLWKVDPSSPRTAPATRPSASGPAKWSKWRPSSSPPRVPAPGKRTGTSSEQARASATERREPPVRARTPRSTSTTAAPSPPPARTTGRSKSSPSTQSPPPRASNRPAGTRTGASRPSPAAADRADSTSPSARRRAESKARETAPAPVEQPPKAEESGGGLFGKIGDALGDARDAVTETVSDAVDVAREGASLVSQGARQLRESAGRVAGKVSRWAADNAGSISAGLAIGGTVLSFTPLAPVGLAMLGTSVAVAAGDTAHTAYRASRGKASWRDVGFAALGMIPGAGAGAARGVAAGLRAGASATNLTRTAYQGARVGIDVANYGNGAIQTARAVADGSISAEDALLIGAAASGVAGAGRARRVANRQGAGNPPRTEATGPSDARRTAARDTSTTGGPQPATAATAAGAMGAPAIATAAARPDGPSPIDTSIQYDSIVGGASSGGMTAALIAHGHGRNVLVLESRGEVATRPNVVIMDGSTRATLQQNSPRRGGIGKREAQASLGSIDNHFRATAAERGLPVHYNQSIVAVRQLDRTRGGGVEVEVMGTDGNRQVLRALTYVDGTGGRTTQARGGRPAALDAPDMTHRRLDPDIEPSRFAMGQFPDNPRFTTAYVKIDRTPVRLFSFHNERDGMSVFADLTPGNGPNGRGYGDLTPEQQKVLHRRAAEAAGLDTSQMNYSTTFTSADQAVVRAADGDIILVGDSVAWKSPYTGQGMNQAVRDGVAAGDAVDAYLSGNDRALAEYGDRTLEAHYRIMGRRLPNQSR